MNSIIFDLDGTLWEVIDSTYKSVNIVAKRNNEKEISKEIICKVFGQSKEGAAKAYFPNMELGRAVELVDEIADVNIENLKQDGGNVYPDVRDVLNNLSEKYSLYIVSNTSKTEYIKAFLSTSNTMSSFKGYIAAGVFDLSKADAIKKIIIDNKIKKAVYVGDTILDYEAAKENDIDFIQAKYGFGKDLNTKYFIDEFIELPDVVEKIL